VNFDNAEAFVALAIFGMGGLWQAASLRGKVHGDWRERVADTQRQLTDRAVRELRGLQADVVELASSDHALPGLATFDPGLVADRARSFSRTLEERARVQRSFILLLKLGWPLVGASVTFLCGTALLFVHSSELLAGKGTQITGSTLMGVGFVVAMIAAAIYVSASQRLSGAEVHAFTPVPADRGDDDDA
jgi:hypothetical protein